MKKLLMNRKPVRGPWGGGNLFVKAICEYAESRGYEVVHSLQQNIDAILMIDSRYDNLGIAMNEISFYKSRNPQTRVVHRVNECDARKATHDMDKMLVSCSNFTDATVFVSNWMKDYFEKSWNCKEQHVAYNGVDQDHFSPLNFDTKYVKNNLHKALNVPIKIIAHHWSSNDLKGFDIYDKLDEWVGNNNDYEFVYIGRSQDKFKNAIVIDPLFGKALGDELKFGSVYVSASRWDPGPNHIIEALACHLPTFVHKDGGGAVEFANSPGAVYSSFEELISKIQQKELWPIKKGWDISWKDCANRYFDIIEGKVS